MRRVGDAPLYTTPGASSRMSEDYVVVVGVQQEEDSLPWGTSLVPLITALNMASCATVLRANLRCFYSRKEPWSEYMVQWAVAQAVFQMVTFTRWILVQADASSSVACVVFWLVDRATAFCSMWAMLVLRAFTLWPSRRLPCQWVTTGLMLSASILCIHAVAVGDLMLHHARCTFALDSSFITYFDTLFFVAFVMMALLAPLFVSVALVSLFWLRAKEQQAEDARMLTTFLLAIFLLSIPSVVEGITTMFAVDVWILDVVSRYCVLLQPVMLLGSLMTSATFREALTSAPGYVRLQQVEKYRPEDSKDQVIEIWLPPEGYSEREGVAGFIDNWAATNVFWQMFTYLRSNVSLFHSPTPQSSYKCSNASKVCQKISQGCKPQVTKVLWEWDD